MFLWHRWFNQLVTIRRYSTIQLFMVEYANYARFKQSPQWCLFCCCYRCQCVSDVIPQYYYYLPTSACCYRKYYATYLLQSNRCN